MQYKIFLASKSSNFRLILKSQKLFTFSLFSRLKVVNDIFNNFKFFNFINSAEKFHIALNLKYPTFLQVFSYFYITKSKGSCLFFDSPNIYVKCLHSLYNSSVSPIVEFKSDKFSFGFRPYRDCQDFFLEIKNFFLNNKKDFSCLNLKLVSVLNFFSNDWLIKNFPLEKRILKSWLNNNLLFSYSFSENKVYPFIGFTSIYNTFFNFLLNGLL